MILCTSCVCDHEVCGSLPRMPQPESLCINAAVAWQKPSETIGTQMSQCKRRTSVKMIQHGFYDPMSRFLPQYWISSLHIIAHLVFPPKKQKTFCKAQVTMKWLIIGCQTQTNQILWATVWLELQGHSRWEKCPQKSQTNLADFVWHSDMQRRRTFFFFLVIKQISLREFEPNISHLNWN